MKINKVIGKILWWSNKDENGVISDSQGNEYYFDRSVMDQKKKSLKFDRGTIVLFAPEKCGKILTGRMVTIPSIKSISKYEEKFEREQIQLKLPLAS
jgi:hypothetical protein